MLYESNFLHNLHSTGTLNQQVNHTTTITTVPGASATEWGNLDDDKLSSLERTGTVCAICTDVFACVAGIVDTTGADCIAASVATDCIDDTFDLVGILDVLALIEYRLFWNQFHIYKQITISDTSR